MKRASRISCSLLYIKYTKPEINLQTTGRGRTLRLLGDNELSYATNASTLHSASKPWLLAARCVGYTDLVAGSSSFNIRPLPQQQAAALAPF